MLTSITIETFQPHLGEVFRIIVDEQHQLLVRLSAVEALPNADRLHRVPFSLLFHGARNSYLPQNTYRVENDGLAAMDIFLVPVGPDDVGMRYEAVFT